ncbi:MAG: DUF853 family protein [Ilumatobacter sp.]|nr:DUF853 family protein [Ilumatobacter sp.]MBT5276987.1 DUF853 family protein [Ilumatobacter sp.]MBT5864545.1 DUF853 family protein [Ilumatobacter sp.]
MADLFLGGAIDPATHERTTDDASSHVSVATDKLTTHGVIVGMTGSGKTGLGVIVIEEALQAGLPVIAIDPKGDLTNLCLTFPDLVPTDFRPWIDEAQAKNAGQTPDEFAASQSELWTKGLGSWGAQRRRHRRTAGESRLHDLHTRITIWRGVEHRRLTAGADRPQRCRGRRRRDRGLRNRPARPRQHRRRSAVESRTHPPVQPDPSFVASGQGHRLNDAGRASDHPSNSQARRVRARPVLP